MKSLSLILGGPGTGKTYRLMELLEQKLEASVFPEQIAFVSFTKKAVIEASERAMEKFRLKSKRLPYFRTLHSLTYRELGLSRSSVMSRPQLEEFGHMMGIRLTGAFDSSDGELVADNGDRMLFLEGLARSTRVPYLDIWHEQGEDLSWVVFDRFCRSYTQYKKDLAVVDFTDMLEQYVSVGSPIPVEVAFIDEAQDLNALQWEVTNLAFKNAKDVIIAGDDDQAIYRWSGAAVDYFIGLKARSDTAEVLPLSRRLPEAVFKVATEIVSRIDQRYPKVWSPRDAQGSVNYHTSVDSLDLTKGEWLLLSRNTHFLDRYARLAESQGVVYTMKGKSSVDKKDSDAILAHEKLRKKDPKMPIWHDALIDIPLARREYYLSILRRGEKLLTVPRVHINTIHSVKGGEAENVAVILDLTKKSYDTFTNNPDDEHRVFYVAVTRAKENLHIISAQTMRSYPL